LILEAHEEAVRRGVENASDDCRLVLNLGKEVGIVAGDEHNIKITTELDLFLAEQLFRLRRKSVYQGTGSVRGKRFAVLGGTGGIGSAVCQKLEAAGAEAIRMSRRTGVDLTRPFSIGAAFKSVGEIDGLINCAGALVVKPLEMHSIEEIEELLQVNFSGLVIACQQAQIRSGGHIINLASSSFTRGRKNYGIYSAAKAAVVNFTQALAEERMDLRVHAVIPQRTQTPMRSDNFPGEEKESLLDPEVVADAVLGLLKDPFGTGSLVEVKKKG
jgi:2-C-methyl-D-erythritol 4-phosphate cytidylyltransferase